MKKFWLLSLSSLSLVVGCSEGGSPAPPPAPAVTAAPPAGGGPPKPVPPPVAPVQEKASVDLTKQGIAAEKMGKGVLATPAREYLRIPDRAAFLAVEQAMNLYKGANGALPKTHEEFMREVIDANNIRLPELPDDSRYVYVPEKGELMIERKQP